ncbi:M23 family metallopeptidase [Palleronia pelagia]|uniref:Peptidase family M23 n=1 Tax=Palleronia pelagia TaxID=387096 RepID=A0A1H8LWF0_9RHOB|nr:M23 family metallopeptidase [Palleronia pelagia]SEO09409.1 Peptidase family M23 [Palleronia pelagia]
MKIRYLATGLFAAGGIATGGILLFDKLGKEPVPPSLRNAATWIPEPMPLPTFSNSDANDLDMGKKEVAPTFTSPAPLASAIAETSAPVIEPLLEVWSREIASGETLDTVLAEAGLVASERAEIALALAAEYDLRRLRPGHGLTVETGHDGHLQRVVLDVDDGVRIETVFGADVATRVLSPESELLIRAAETRIESSLFAALADAGIPARFAVDLAQMLGGTVDFRRDLSGGEIMRLMWREERVEGGVIGQPELDFAVLDLGDTQFEIVWPEDGTGRATIYRDGEMMRVFAQPVEGARLSSVFGRRAHPVYGDTRMHTGVDFAAPRGTPISATAPGRISFIGRRGGYGRVVEISHGSETMTRYAHLSAVPDGLAVGDRVAAGDTIGRVGATGTATGPNLHYEVRVNGRPTDPLSDDRLAEAVEHEERNDDAIMRLGAARTLLDEHLAGLLPTNPNERL